MLQDQQIQILNNSGVPFDRKGHSVYYYVDFTALRNKL